MKQILLLFSALFITLILGCEGCEDCNDTTPRGTIFLVPEFGPPDCPPFELTFEDTFFEEGGFTPQIIETFDEDLENVRPDLWLLRLTIKGTCDDGSEFDEAFTPPGQVEVVNINGNIGLEVNGVPINRDLLISLEIWEPCTESPSQFDKCLTCGFETPNWRNAHFRLIELNNVMEEDIRFINLNASPISTVCNCLP